MSKMLPIVAIVGRPNVGKSTLFNAIIGRRKAIVSDIAGTTRDSIMEKVTDLGKIPFWLLDTAGLSDFGDNSLEQEIQAQARIALENADAIIWVLDGKESLTQDDYDVAEILRKKNEKVIFCANKVDDGSAEKTYEFASLGFGLPEILSAKNNFGFWEFTETVEKKLDELGLSSGEAEVEDDTEVIQVALVGRPNVGKSTLFNQLIGDDRSVVSDVAGTTRDSIDTEFSDEDGQKYIFMDTAGVRKPGKIGRDMEFWSVVRTQRSIERADICVLLIDSLDGVTHQDLALAGEIVKAGKGLVIGVNKFDLAREKARAQEETDDRELEEVPMWEEDIAKIRDRYLDYLHKKIKFVPWAPVLFFSAKTGKGVQDIFASLKGIHGERCRRIPTRELNLLVPDIYYGHVTPIAGNKKGKIKYASQVDGKPPKFLFFVNNIAAFHFSYKRYIENKIRDKYGFEGTPIVIELRDAMKRWRDNPEGIELPKD